MRQYAKLSDVKAGDKLIADSGFTCIGANEIVTVQADDDGHLFVPCDHGRHHLDGQADDGETLVGLFKAEG